MKKYKVSEECIGCSACVGAAEDNFEMDDDTSLAYLKKQPESDDELALCEDALDGCPVDAISSDE